MIRIGAVRFTAVGVKLGLRYAAIAGALLVAAVAAGIATVLLVPAQAAGFTTVRANWMPSEAYLLDRNGAPLDQVRMDYKHRRFEWVPLDAVSPALIAAVVDGEDRRFWEHDGVDWAAVVGAVREAGVSQRLRGASTITMQLAKHLQPEMRAGRSPGALRRKLAQVRMARALEAHWSKRQILEAYLNLVTFRGELQGVDAASRMLAGKAPQGLTLEESVVLAALLPSPAASPNLVVTRACARAAARRVIVGCDEIRARGVEILDRYDRSGGEPPANLHQAPHLARAVLKRGGQRVRTTLDASVQRLANDVLRQHLAGLTARNVRDGAVLVVDNATGDVLAYVGSAGATSRAREVDGVRARRQAGSTLKPFLYELAIERGYLNASSLLDDAPVALDTASGIYLPQNYDKDFKGLVSVRTALGSSLNVPAVRTLVLTGVDAFRDRLQAVGYVGISRPGEFYGYALALGSPEVSLWEQVQAYRVLGRGGEWSGISALRDAAGRMAQGRAQQVRLKSTSAGIQGDVALGEPANVRPGTRVMSHPATFIVTDILSDRAARTVTFGLDNYLNTPFWSAVKTGTSKDMRDNWCIGFSREFTVGVWVGNFEGDSMHDVSGITGAAPVWNQIMLSLHAGRPSAAPAMPEGVIASTAHFTPAVEAPRRELLLLVGKAQTQHSIAAATAVTAVTAGGEIAHIASPANGMVIAIDPDIPPAFQRVPLKASGATEGMVLKLNGTVLGQATGNVLWAPKRGAHLLALEDSSGHTLDSAHFVVR